MVYFGKMLSLANLNLAVVDVAGRLREKICERVFEFGAMAEIALQLCKTFCFAPERIRESKSRPRNLKIAGF
jgi:hypothetical protein